MNADLPCLCTAFFAVLLLLCRKHSKAECNVEEPGIEEVFLVLEHNNEVVRSFLIAFFQIAPETLALQEAVAITGRLPSWTIFHWLVEMFA
jgi:hypothetical protein